jgi:hypothetical protein
LPEKGEWNARQHRFLQHVDVNANESWQEMEGWKCFDPLSEDKKSEQKSY